MNVLSLFDGISCGQVALQRSGIHVSQYFASEIDKYAIKVTQKNFPNTIQIGDVCSVKGADLPKIDILMGGSPCQGFSFAGKQLNFDDPRSMLFFEYVRLLKECNPKYFLLENVKMKKVHQDVISEYLGVAPILINSALLSAQNRQRLYWTNIPGTEQPEEKGVILKDVLQTVEEVCDYGLSNKAVDYMNRATRDGRTHWDFGHHSDSKESKSKCVTANMYKGVPYNVLIDSRGLEKVEECLENGITEVAFTERRTEEAKQIRREFQKKHGRDFSPRRAKELVSRSDGKMNCLTATYSLKEHSLIDRDSNYRKLTPVECERLQTLPDNYTEGISNTQRYKSIGNGWTVDVVAHLMKGIKDGTI